MKYKNETNLELKEWGVIVFKCRNCKLECNHAAVCVCACARTHVCMPTNTGILLAYRLADIMLMIEPFVSDSYPLFPCNITQISKCLYAA